ncbi:helix-turn-helix transcriptional regulator [Cupriavidus oxalaticus]|uniref:helix-turn-helix transcriptional regulator n=1 Tax=Cupriavidus oxalaticus TaxID=96344 RepID=UPI0031812C26
MNLGPMGKKRGAHAAHASAKANRVWRDVKSKLVEQAAWCSSKPQGGDEPEEAKPEGSATPVAAAMPDSQREHHVKRALTRFARNKNKPEELETLRYNLIAARIMSGMTAVDAAKRFGYANSTQISLIESGARPTPKDHQFLRQAARVYAVSTDFLLGLSPHMEFDSKVAQQHALMRHTEDLVGGLASQLATALIRFSEDEQLTAGEVERLGAAALRVDETLDRLRTRFGFDDMPGTAPHLAAVEQLIEAAEPVRRRLKKRQTLQEYVQDVRAGLLPLIPAVRERYSQAAVRAQVLGASIDSENS